MSMTPSSATLIMVTSSSSLQPSQLVAASKLYDLYWPNLEYHRIKAGKPGEAILISEVINLLQPVRSTGPRLRELGSGRGRGLKQQDNATKANCFVKSFTSSHISTRYSLYSLVQINTLHEVLGFTQPFPHQFGHKCTYLMKSSPSH